MSATKGHDPGASEWRLGDPWDTDPDLPQHAGAVAWNLVQALAFDICTRPPSAHPFSRMPRPARAILFAGRTRAQSWCRAPARRTLSPGRLRAEPCCRGAFAPWGGPVWG